MTTLACPDCGATTDAAAYVAPFENVQSVTVGRTAAITAVLPTEWDQSWHADGCLVASEHNQAWARDLKYFEDDPMGIRNRRATIAERIAASILAKRPLDQPWKEAATVGMLVLGKPAWSITAVIDAPTDPLGLQLAAMQADLRSLGL